MIEIIAIVMGLVTVIRGKFKLNKDKILYGWRARVCGGVLLCHIPIMVVGCVLLGATGSLDEFTPLILSFCSLATVITFSFVLGFSLYRGQAEEQSAQQAAI